MACRNKICNPPQNGKAEDLLDPWVEPDIKQAMKDMILDNDTLKKEMKLFMENVDRGLKRDTHDAAVIKCFPTFIQDLPDGTEKGKYFALDLGGTNFRVLLINLEEDKCESNIFVIPDEILVGTGTMLFDCIAQCLAEFANAHNVQDDNLPLGFCFSFPCEQNGLTSAILKRWTKGFNCEDVVDSDVGKWLMDALERRDDIKIDVCAIINDTAGTLMACAWKNPTCRIGYIIGTGSNACYVEKLSNVEMYDGPDEGSGRMIINLEMGAFGEDGAIDFLRTEEDKINDMDSLHVGKQIHEKCVSGMYLGEIVRLRTLKLIKGTKKTGLKAIGNILKSTLIFDSGDASAFKKKDVFTSEMISEIESDPVGTFSKTKKILHELGVKNPSVQDMYNFRYICQTVSRRSAHLVSTSICALIEKMGEPHVVVAIDGSVYKHHPHFDRVMREKIKELIAPGFTFDLMLSEDGSGRGAALVAAVAARKKREEVV
ncbi:unnamed protein product [Ceutorhynchus assimilis]|uniref:Phosphotransferase n=1 Tax=Ceutorhynchus assimilis TaxID=467358 RepID=A0A9N9MU83_9CUCU|nr:unnamed protein product [Ceutorhynchus assimilis]